MEKQNDELDAVDRMDLLKYLIDVDYRISSQNMTEVRGAIEILSIQEEDKRYLNYWLDIVEVSVNRMFEEFDECFEKFWMLLDALKKETKNAK